MRRALEIFCRQRRQFLLLLVILPLLSVVIGFFIPRPYQASASIWAANRYNITNATWASEWYKMLGVDNGIPAQTQAEALTELLSSRTFALQVAKATDLVKQVSVSTAQQRDDALVANISTNVKVTADGNNLVTISYSNADSHIAVQVLTATIHAFMTTSQQLAIQSGQQLLAADQTQLTALQNALEQAQSNLTAYQHGRSDGQLKADPYYQTLSQDVTSAQSNVANVQSQIGQLQIELSTMGSQPDAFFSVQDAPALVPSKTSRTQTILLALAVGIAIALVITATYLAILMRADQAVYSTADLKAVLSVPVLAEIPAVVLSPPMRTIFTPAAPALRPVGSGTPRGPSDAPSHANE